MASYFITGKPGTGKSVIARALSIEGYAADVTQAIPAVVDNILSHATKTKEL